MAGQGFVALSLSCAFGAVRPVAGRWLSSQVAECVAPAHAPGLVLVEMGTAYPAQYSIDGAAFAFAAEAAEASEATLLLPVAQDPSAPQPAPPLPAAPASVLTASPAWSLTEGGTALDVLGVNFAAVATMACR